MKNFAGTPEHKQYLSRYDYIFSEPYFQYREEIILSEAYRVLFEDFNHTYETSNNMGMSISCQQFILFNALGETLFKERYVFGKAFSHFFRHSDNCEYFMCGHDLNNLSVFNVTNRQTCQFISGYGIIDGVRDYSRNYFWYIRELLYNSTNNLLAFNGQDLMNGATAVIADVTLPMTLPYHTASLGSISHDGVCWALSWNDDGSLKIGIGEEEYEEIDLAEKAITELLTASKKAQ